MSDGKSHLMDFRVNDVEMGVGASELALAAPASVHVTANVAALLDETPDETIRKHALRSEAVLGSRARAHRHDRARCRWNWS